MFRRLLVLLALALPLHAASRWVTELASGPVKWEAWGPAAFARATKESRPLFVAIGFASSWECEQMKRDAFPNNADILNNAYVPVVVDAIEHPEIARRYDGAITVVLTPALDVLASGGFMNGDELRRMLTGKMEPRPREPEAPRKIIAADDTTMQAVVDAIAKTYDAEHGGFGGAPRTPHATTLAFLLRFADRTKHEGIRGVVGDTLTKLARLPIHDPLAGGFHRATRDAAWREPYFEKLLCDQALLANVYLDAWQLTKNPEFARVARTTLDYIVRDLPRPGGGFDASQDAFSLVPASGGPELVNGAFYRWDPSEGEAKRLVALKRPAPFRETNLITGWNGLAISALARGGAVLGEARYVEAAASAARVVTSEKKLMRAEGVEALAEDYAMLVAGLVDLFDATSDPAWLDRAAELQQRQDALFWDASAGRYTAPAPENDRDTPSANAVSVENLLRLATLTGNDVWRERPAMIFTSFGARLRSEGADLPAIAAAYEDAQRTGHVVVVTGDPRKKETHDLLTQSHASFDPRRVVVFLPPKGPSRDRIVHALPFAGALEADPEHAIAYVCANGECRRQ